MSKVVVVGGGIAGLATGIAFKKAKWDVQVLERAQRIEPLGAALSIWPNACAALSDLGALEPLSKVAAPIRTMLLAEKDGRPIFSRRIDGPALLTTRAALQDTLVNQLGSEALKLNCPVKQIEGRVLRLANGQSLEADLIIDAGGIRSPSNRVENPRYAGYGGVLALTHPVDGPSLNGLAAEYWGKNERFGVFEIPEGRRYWFYMRTQPVDAPMPSLSDCLDRVVDWPESIRIAVQATTEAALIPFAVHSNPPPRSLGDRNVLRVGDAAHAMEPNQGQGACQGIEDAAAILAMAATCDPANFCKAYEALRLKRARMFVKESARVRVGVHGPAIAQQFLRAALTALPQSVTERSIKRMQTMPDYRAQAR